MTAAIERDTLILVDPSSLRIEIDPEKRGRSKPPSEQQVRELAHSLRTVGQQQPITVYETDTGHDIAFGYTRAEAGQLVQRGFAYNGKEYDPLPDFLLKAVVIPKPKEKDLFEMKLVENEDRTNLSIIDKAKMIQVGMTKYNFSQKRMGERFKMRQATVSRTLKLLELPDDVQDAIHDGMISASVGVEVQKYIEAGKLTPADAGVFAGLRKEDSDGDQRGYVMSELHEWVQALRIERGAAQAATEAEMPVEQVDEPEASTPDATPKVKVLGSEYMLFLMSSFDVTPGGVKGKFSDRSTKTLTAAMNVLQAAYLKQITPEQAMEQFGKLLPKKAA